MTVSDDLSEVLNTALDLAELTIAQAEYWPPFGLMLYRQSFVTAPGPMITMRQGPHEHIGLVLPDLQELAQILSPASTLDDLGAAVANAIAQVASAGHVETASLCQRAESADGERTAMVVWIEHAEGASLRVQVPYVRSDAGAVTLVTTNLEPETRPERIIFR